ncbi:hypothetical protein ACN4EK_09835 [Pantanalinema rosaneae CENA516]|uniref:hypothetical protein n=1 Tax=Pantanalinema rosaneae TaxID=1620701 RepID=UPI003D6EE27D
MTTAKKSSISTLDTVPLVVREQQVVLFKFYMDQAICEGMTHTNELYRLVKVFPVKERLEAYRFGCELILQGAPVVITVSQERYAVWASLRNGSTATEVRSAA